MERIDIRITTKTNLFIGDTPSTFEIGGIDAATKINYQGLPVIPASSFKGVLKRIIRDMAAADNQQAKKIEDAYRAYLNKLWQENDKRIKKMSENVEEERLNRMAERFRVVIEKASVEYIFGIMGFNDTPKLIFGDFLPAEKEAQENYFSIDSKNAIMDSAVDNGLRSLPRVYKTVRPEIAFCGNILLHRMELLEMDGIEEFIKSAVLEFNDGIYRLGNSGSRGYGRIETEIV